MKQPALGGAAGNGLKAYNKKWQDQFSTPSSDLSNRRIDRPRFQRTVERIHDLSPRAHFARQATIDAFEWRYAKSLDQGDFVDHPPRKTDRLTGAIVVGSS